MALALCSVLINSKPAAALSVEDYFTFSYVVEFSKTRVEEGEAFQATVTVEATCTKDLPLSASEASITGRIIAEHQASGARVTLNPNYSANIKPLPSKKGDTAQVSKVIALQFPQGSQSGTYSVVGELIKAQVKVLSVWIEVTDYLPASQKVQTIGSVTYISDNSDDGGGGGGGGSGTPSPGISDVSDFVSADGTFTETVVAESFDGKCELTIDEGTKGLTQEGTPLTEIAITEIEGPPAPPENCDTIGLTYDFKPDGATFEPPITVNFTYDPAEIPEGVSEEDLVIAVWDEDAGKWVKLESCTVDPETNIIAAPVSHFTAFTILAYTRLATFIASELSITPVETDIGEDVTISALVTNTGDLAGKYKVTLKIDNVAVATKEITLAGGASEEITFTTTEDVAGTYTVNVDGLPGSFVVGASAAFVASELSITPVETDIGEDVTISALVTNTGDLAGKYKVTLKIDNVAVATKEITLAGGASEEITFTTTEDVAGTYTVNVDGLSGSFVVGIPQKSIYWWLIGGSIAVIIIIIALIVWLVVRRRAA